MSLSDEMQRLLKRIQEKIQQNEGTITYPQIVRRALFVYAKAAKIDVDSDPKS